MRRVLDRRDRVASARVVALQQQTWRRARARACIAAVLVACAVLFWVLCPDGVPGFLAHFAPALLLLGALLRGRYPGEHVLARRIGSRRRAPRVPPRALPLRTRTAWVAGGALLSRNLAVRPPPADAASA